MSPTISLVVSTLGRTLEVDRLLRSLCSQSFTDFEVVLVDQNEDNRLDSVVHQFTERLSLRRVQSKRGASIGRNRGLQEVTGRLVTFPDDDCWYAPETLSSVMKHFLHDQHLAGVTALTSDPAGKPHVSISPGSGRPQRVSRLRVWFQATECGMFLNTTAVRAVGAFDENLGIGSTSPWQSGEGTDLLLKLLAQGSKLVYDPSIRVLHAAAPVNLDARSAAKRTAYGRGMGYVLRRHRFPLWFTALAVLHPLATVPAQAAAGHWSLVRNSAPLSAARLRGWWEGAQRHAQ